MPTTSSSLPSTSLLENKFTDKLSKFLANLTQTKFEQRNAIKYKFVFDHHFDFRPLKEPTFCSQCGDFFLIPWAQQCQICKFTCHPGCLNRVNSGCLNSPKVLHNFKETSFLTPTYCKHCGSYIIGIPGRGFECSRKSGGCGLTIHKGCKELTRKRCIKRDLKSTGSESVKSSTVCVGDFDFLGILGKGVTSTVYLAQLKNGTKKYAIKSIKKNNEVVLLDPESPLTEASALKQGISSPFLTKLHCCFQTSTRLFLVMEYVPGFDLAHHLRENHTPIKLTEERARFYAAELVLALFHLHSMNFIYRDLKPENIIIDHEGHCKLIDFGLAKELSESNDLTSRTICGTPPYMSPEVIEGLEYSFPVDWWALGVLIFEMLTGFLPFDGDNCDELFKNISNREVNLSKYIHSLEARDLIARLLEKKQADRLGSRSEQDVFEHSFFSAYNWQDIAGKRLKPPFIPSRASLADAPDNKLPISLSPEGAGPEVGSVSKDAFAGFSYYSESFCSTDHVN